MFLKPQFYKCSKNIKGFAFRFDVKSGTNEKVDFAWRVVGVYQDIQGDLLGYFQAELVRVPLDLVSCGKRVWITTASSVL